MSPNNAGARPGHFDEPGVRKLTVTIPVVPPFIRRGWAKLQGVILMVLALLGGVALSTWTISDPSLTFANGSTAENWLGFWGASFADFTMQFLGFASIALLLPLMVWGIQKFALRPIGHLAPRVGYWIGGLVFLATALACLPMPSGWPLQVGLGGVIGDAILGIPRAFTGSYPQGFISIVLFALFIVPAAWLLVRACDLPGRSTPRQAQAPAAHEDPDMIMEQELYDDPSMADPSAEYEASGRDWGALIAAPIGLVMHLGYSLSSLLSRRRRHTDYDAGGYAPHAQSEGWVEPMIDAAGLPETLDSEPVATDFHHEYDAADMDEPPFEVDEPTVLARQPSVEDDEPIPHTDAAQPEPVVSRVARRAKPKPSNGKFILPDLDLLSDAKAIVEDPSLSNEALEENARILEGVLEDFGVKGNIIKVRPGPVVTLYELEPAPGVKSSRVIGLAEDIARSMSAIAARVAVVPGRNAIGIELPNKRRETVYLREQLSSPEFKKTKAKLAMCLGKTIGGEPVIADLAKMPHLLVAGTTGSGKSVAINTMILSLLYRLGPEKCKLIMIDPKMLELSIYDGIPHLLTPVVVDPKKAVVALKWTVREMEERYKKMSKVGVRNIDGFNTRINEAAARGEVITRTVQTGFDRETGEAIYEHEELDLEPMPFIVVIIDEMADLMMVAGKDIEGTVQRLAQMARAAGIHVVMATQRPSVDVITGTIKANFPTRISFQVTSKIDSRTILGEMGAEQLLGMGDMLYMAGGGRITRVHGPFVDDQEVEDVVNHLKAQGVPQYLEAVTEESEEDAEEGGAGGGGSAGNMSSSDDPYDRAVAIVLNDRKASTSYIQRRLSVGYNKAASLIERMEQEGLISPANHAGKREILVPAEDETI
ncbi:MAG: DNA translocase FtsK [Rhizobiaceae bacterium]|nr:DNA translocase FtsK [Hyphomicrobiales bacterium]NRB31845.1 DNA translocase FtsK [Rhizobiaceae bacterium]